MATLSPEERAASLVRAVCKTPGEPWFVEASGTNCKPVRFGPYANPSLAQEDAQRLQSFVAEVIAEAASGS
jgi:hypothetical protein